MVAKGEGTSSNEALGTGLAPQMSPLQPPLSAASNSTTDPISPHQSKEQQDKQQRQLEAARVHARTALLVAASVCLPSASLAQAEPHSLILPSSSSSKTSSKGKQQRQQYSSTNTTMPSFAMPSADVQGLWTALLGGSTAPGVPPGNQAQGFLDMLQPVQAAQPDVAHQFPCTHQMQ